MTPLASDSVPQLLAPKAPDPSAPYAIETERLSRRFGNKVAVCDVSLRIPAGSTYGLIGLNGAGKSTMIRMLVGLLPPTSGRAILRGVDVWKDRVRSKLGLGYVPDRPVAYPWMRVEQVIAFCRRFQPKWSDAYAADLLKRFRLDPVQRIAKLSKGGGAKLSLLLALSHDPEVLILDEPTDGLDPIARDDFLESVLASVCERQRTVLMSSHSLSDVQRMADWIGLIHDGRLIVQCPTEELVRTTKRVRLVLPDGAAPPSPPAGTIFQRRDGRQWTLTIRNFSPAMLGSVGSATAVEDMSLDDIFKDFVRGQETSP